MFLCCLPKDGPSGERVSLLFTILPLLLYTIYMPMSIKKCNYYLIVAPNGINASFASLNHCKPNGIPRIVMMKNTPINRYPTVISHPKKITQSIFKIGCLSKCVTTSLPNGVMTSVANLKHCFPIGIPIMVIKIIIPLKSNQWQQINRQK
jgi:hypothetical protein